MHNVREICTGIFILVLRRRPCVLTVFTVQLMAVFVIDISLIVLKRLGIGAVFADCGMFLIVFIRIFITMLFAFHISAGALIKVRGIVSVIYTGKVVRGFHGVRTQLACSRMVKRIPAYLFKLRIAVRDGLFRLTTAANLGVGFVVSRIGIQRKVMRQIKLGIARRAFAVMCAVAVIARNKRMVFDNGIFTVGTDHAVRLNVIGSRCIIMSGRALISADAGGQVRSVING